MNVEVLVVPDCPSEAGTVQRLRAVLREFDLPGDVVRVTVIDTWESAGVRGFHGSPTIRLNGVDPFPAPGGPASLSCRLYPTSGGLTGLPPLAQLREAVQRALDHARPEGHPPVRQREEGET